MVEARISKRKHTLFDHPEKEPEQKAALGIEMPGPTTAPTAEEQGQKEGAGHHLHRVYSAASVIGMAMCTTF